MDTKGRDPCSGRDIKSNRARKRLAIAIALLAVSPAISAAVFHSTGGDAPCLIAAINSANATPAADTIILDAGTYNLTAVNNIVNGDPNGLPVISSPIAIRGAGMTTTIIQPDPSIPGFRILQVAVSGNLTLDSLTIRNGILEDSLAGGAGIYNVGKMTILNAAVSNNFDALGNDGGRLLHRGTATILNSAITNNREDSGGAGAGISNVGSIELIGSLVEGNGANNTSCGGIASGGTLKISGSTIRSNGSGISG